jgi:general secretion pathway protein H
VSRRYHPGGFTLLELVVVLALLALAATLVVPRLPAMQESRLRASVRQLSAQLRYLDERAVAGKVPYRLRLNLDEQKIDVVQKTATGDEAPPDDPYLQRSPLQEGVIIRDLRTERLGTISSGTVRISYGPGGLSESFLIHLAIPGGSEITVQALPVSGIVKIADGYLEEIGYLEKMQ